MQQNSHPLEAFVTELTENDFEYWDDEVDPQAGATGRPPAGPGGAGVRTRLW